MKRIRVFRGVAISMTLWELLYAVPVSAMGTRETDAARTAEAAVVAEAAEQARFQALAERSVALEQAQQVQEDKVALRTQLRQQLNAILQTRDSAHGLIVNLSGVLFETGQSELRPAGREKLSKISRLLLAHPDLRLAIEGHTDNVGTDAHNQKLSEQRAISTRVYLIGQGVPQALMLSSGFGDEKPMASNDTAAGRQQNRRVELVVSGEIITASLLSQ